MKDIYDFLAVFGAVSGAVGTVWSAYNSSTKKPQIFMDYFYARLVYQQGSRAVIISKAQNKSLKKVLFFQAESDTETGAPISPKVKSYIMPGSDMSMGLVLRPGEMVAYVIAQSEDGRVGAPGSRPLAVSLEKDAFFKPAYTLVIEEKNVQPG